MKAILYILTLACCYMLGFLTCYYSHAQEIKIEHFRDSANISQFKITVPRNNPHGPWVTIGPVTYQNFAQSMWRANDSIYYTYITFINFVDTTANPVKIKAKNFTSQGGNIDAAGHVGVFVQDSIVGFINAGDYLHYSNVLLKNLNRVKIRYSSNALPVSPRTVELRKDSATGEILCSFEIKPTGNWNTWIEQELEFFPVEGSFSMYVTFTGTGYICNLDEFVFWREN